MREMKDSGVEWIGEIPETWIVERLQWHLDEIKESNNPIKTTQVLSLTNKAGVIPYEDKGEQGNKAKENYDEYKLAYPDTIVANSMNILIGSVGICRYFGCVSPVYYVFKPKENELLSYLNYVFQMEQFQKELRRYANGILEIRLRLSSANIIKRYVAFPSHEEQIAISHFLDRKCTQIDALISNAQQQIEKLKAYKQSVITETVTKGLDPDVTMKDSGVEWIGEIPEDWEIVRIKNICQFNPSSKKSFSDDDIVSYAPMECVRTGSLVHKEIAIKNVSSGLTYFEENDIIMAKVTPCFENGNIAIATGLTKGVAFGSSELFVFRANESIKFFLFYFLQNNIFKKFSISTMTGTGGLKRVSPNFVNNYSFALPPIEERNKIVFYLDHKCSRIDKLIALKQQKVEKLQQYKKSLIYEYVTGKKEV